MIHIDKISPNVIELIILATRVAKAGGTQVPGLAEQSEF